ncbi:MAG: hypothetical protein IPO83_03635 [Chitinophagaceae bacterium]|nr:hypothetical protein [Chitinophagaceae bacterium]
MKLIICLAILFAMYMPSLKAQFTTNKEIGEKNKAHMDSVSEVLYPYILPIWGEKATQKGFKLQYSAGLSLNYIGQNSDLIINNLMVGFNNGEMYNLDEIIRFNSAVATTNGINLRPDLWVLPFLNVYGILAKSKTSTSIDAGVYIPQNDSTWTEIFPLSAKAEFDATTLGFGITPTIGVGGFFMIFDMNFSWSDIDELEKPAFAFIFDPRFGKNFVIKNDMNIAVWTGAFRVKINSGTSGSINLSDLFTFDDAEEKIDEGYAKVESGQQSIDDWWGSLTALEQKNPVNIAKYETSNQALQTAGNILATADVAVNTISTSTIQYSLNKKQKQMWNFTIGSQFQINRHFMVRAEVGFLGSRTQLMGGLQYRFGL